MANGSGIGLVAALIGAGVVGYAIYSTSGAKASSNPTTLPNSPASIAGLLAQQKKYATSNPQLSAAFGKLANAAITGDATAAGAVPATNAVVEVVHGVEIGAGAYAASKILPPVLSRVGSALSRFRPSLATEAVTSPASDAALATVEADLSAAAGDIGPLISEIPAVLP